MVHVVYWILLNCECRQVNNTDAEGRLTLADALVYACNQGVEKVMKHHLFFPLHATIMVVPTR